VERVEPRPQYHEHYRDFVAAYIQAFDQLRGLNRVLAELRSRPFGGH
jgi:hypothetical protein